MIIQAKGCLPGKVLALLTAALINCFVPPAAGGRQSAPGDRRPCDVVVVGFVGGMRSPEDPTQGVVQIGNRLRGLGCAGLRVDLYRHWYWRKAYRAIYHDVDRDRDNSLSKEEIGLAPKVVIYGHSLGGWAVIKLSRKLEGKGIRVALTVQIDSVGVGDEVVPGNVESAANYYQRTAAILRGEKRIRAEDENRTKVVGNFLVKGVGHESLARRAEISDYLTGEVLRLCRASADDAWHQTP